MLWFVGVALFGNRLLWRVVGVWDFALLNPLGGVAWRDNENCCIGVPAFAGMTGLACWVTGVEIAGVWRTPLECLTPDW